MAISIPGLIGAFDFPYVLLWLLTFAVVYGLLEQVKMPASKPARAIISVVVGFLVLMSAPATLISILARMSSAFVLVIIGVLVVVAFLEVAQVRHIEAKKVKTEKGEGWQLLPPKRIFEKHPYAFATFFIIIAVLIFIGSGGLKLLGWDLYLTSASLTGIGFLIAVLLAILWMIGIGEKKEED